MQAYEKNIKKSLLNDSTMWLWNDRWADSPGTGAHVLLPAVSEACCAVCSALKEARIPAGPRWVLLSYGSAYLISQAGADATLVLCSRLVLLHHVDRYRTTLERGMLPPPPPPPFRQPQRPDST